MEGMETQMQYLPANENHMPQWTRMGQLDKNRYPKSFTRDSYRAPIVTTDTRSSETAADNSPIHTQQEESVGEASSAIRVDYLEKSIKFLKVQHNEILQSLHKEIDSLRKDNKELHFQLIMLSQKSHSSEGSAATSNLYDTQGQSDVHGATPSSNSNEKAVVALEQQVKDLRLQLKQLMTKNSQSKAKPGTPGSRPESGEENPDEHGTGLVIDLSTIPGLNASHKAAILVREGRDQEARPAKREELQRIAVHLDATSKSLTEQLHKVKLDLREVLYSHKWSPEAFLLAKGYGVANKTKADANLDVRPRDQMVGQGGFLSGGVRRKLPSIGAMHRHGMAHSEVGDGEQLSLPALKNTVGTKAVERRKRTQILQKARLVNKQPL